MSIPARSQMELPMEHFVHDDPGYLRWLARHPAG